jgi:hypothetical protein
MKYHCGHEGCDICGARECAGIILHKYGANKACDSCARQAIALAIEAAQQFGGIMIDLSKQCGRARKGGVR